jgi:uroporphyrinogen-III synthase
MQQERRVAPFDPGGMRIAVASPREGNHKLVLRCRKQDAEAARAVTLAIDAAHKSKHHQITSDALLHF